MGPIYHLEVIDSINNGITSHDGGLKVYQFDTKIFTGWYNFEYTTMSPNVLAFNRKSMQSCMVRAISLIESLILDSTNHFVIKRTVSKFSLKTNYQDRDICKH